MTEKTTMSDINEPVVSSDSTQQVKKVRFKKFRKFNEKRNKNTDKYSKYNLGLLLLFPLFIVSMAEINQAKYVIPYLKFWIERPTVMLFDVFVTGIIFALLLFIVKRGWIAILAQSIVYMALSTTELFKYGTNGNHLIISDMKLVRSVKSLSSFAYIKITPRLIIYYILVIAFVALAFYLNPVLRRKPLHRIIGSVVCVLFGFCMIVFPVVYKPVYSFFRIDTTRATNTFLLNEKFAKNRFLAFIVETSSESYSNRLVVPDDYSEEKINEIMNIPVDTDEDFNGGQKPNVIVIMSESYADFRAFDELAIDENVYANFDKARDEGKAGIVITPTYASWTVRSEFELLFGLPVRGINTPNMPQRELADREQPAFAQYYKSWGYNTIYVHPFQSGFYSRQRIYGHFGFEKMIYHDDQAGTTDFTVPIEHYGTYVDDSTVFNQIIEEINTSDKPVYLHTTTMQNHQPYNQGEDPNNEFGNYLQWIQHTNENLDVFLSEIEKIDEPTLVFFVGDHFPSLRGESSVYNQLGLTGDNCSKLYEQKYFFWSNYDADFSSVPDENVSFFYVPYIILDIIDAPHDAFIEKMQEFMKTVPVYSTEYDSEVPENDELNLITIDRAVMEEYSPSPIPEEQLRTD